MADLPADPVLDELARDADHVDCKVFEGPADLRWFVVGLFGRAPGWMSFLYKARGWLAKVLGIEHQPPDKLDYRPQDVPMQPGAELGMWTVKAARDGELWAASIADSHLEALLVDVCEPAGNAYRHYLVTIVHYRNRIGPLYFNLIRPFHHLVVWDMGRRAVKAGK